MAPRDPEELEATGAPASALLAASTTVGAVHLTVADLDRSIDYYVRAVGLEVLGRDGGSASLGRGGRELVCLVEERGAQPAGGHTGLYHFALLVPARIDLARWLAHAARDQVALVGLSDHFVSEAVYLSDPDEHGIEIYWDRPRELWEGQVADRMTTLPLDVDDLLGELPDPRSEAFDGLPSGTIMGHVHLKVARHYRDDRLLPRRARLRADGAAWPLRRVPQRRRLSPPRWREHLGERRRHAAPTGERGAAPRDDRAARRERARSCARAVGGQPVERLQRDATGNIIRDPSGNSLALALAHEGV